MDLKIEYLADLNLFRERTQKIARLILGNEDDKCEAMWLLGCIHEICNCRIREINLDKL